VVNVQALKFVGVSMVAVYKSCMCLYEKISQEVRWMTLKMGYWCRDIALAPAQTWFELIAAEEGLEGGVGNGLVGIKQ
jgi:hypothetical protein